MSKNLENQNFNNNYASQKIENPNNLNKSVIERPQIIST